MISARHRRIRWTTGQMRRLLVLVLVGALSVLAACTQATSTEPARPADADTALVRRALSVGVRTGASLAVAPTERPAGFPLMIVLHGRGISAQQESGRTGFLTYAEQGLVDIAYPAGISESWNAGHGCCGVAA